MSFRIVLSPEAERHLVEIFRYIEGEASPATAKRFTDEIVDYCLGLTTFPRRGTSRNDLREGLRTIGFRRRVTIAFEAGADTIVIVGIYYGGRDFEADFRIDGDE